MSRRLKGGCIKVCETCAGSDALTCDLEDLCPYLGVRLEHTFCLDRCKSGPNCLVLPARAKEAGDRGEQRGRRKHGGGSDESERQRSRRRRRSDSGESRGRRGKDRGGDPGRRRRRVVSELWTHQDSLRLLSTASGRELDLPEAVLRRARLRSEAVRLAGEGTFNRNVEKIAEAERLLTEAIAFEGEEAMGLPAAPFAVKPLIAQTGPSDRRRELLLLRGELRGSRELSRFAEAVADLDEVVAQEPGVARAWAEKAKVLRRWRRPAEALTCLRQALCIGQAVGDEQDEAPEGGVALQRHVRSWAERCAELLEERVLQQARVDTGEFGNADAGDDMAVDSGSGSGWWKVVGITGVSWNTCYYDLENHPPASPHPCPHDAWHVKICLGNAVREYTPVSNAEEWEKGRLRLLVKTYTQGLVSRRFAQLREANAFAETEEQRCWVQVSAPQVTLKLGQLAPATKHLGLVVGGTGVAPALQLLREAGDQESAFAGACRAVLLYSSRAEQDVFLLDELRALEAASAGCVVVRHTLTDTCEGGGGDLQSDGEDASAMLTIPSQHHRFASHSRPFRPETGPLRVGADEEAGLRGRVCRKMLDAVLPLPGPGTHVIISGPPQMWEDVSAMLRARGHAAEDLTELKAFSVGQEG